MYDKMNKELNGTIKSAYSENSADIKNEIINRKLTLKITLNGRRIKSGENSSEKKGVIMVLWCSGYHYCTTSFN